MCEPGSLNEHYFISIMGEHTTPLTWAAIAVVYMHPLRSRAVKLQNTPLHLILGITYVHTGIRITVRTRTKHATAKIFMASLARSGLREHHAVPKITIVSHS